MNNWNKLRAWINKNDGEHYQLDNQKLNFFEVSGYLLIIFAFVAYLFHDKVGFQFAWAGWLCLVIGGAALFVGIVKKLGNGVNT